jgi:hypothetical protein
VSFVSTGDKGEKMQLVIVVILILGISAYLARGFLREISMGFIFIRRDPSLGIVFFNFDQLK